MIPSIPKPGPPKKPLSVDPPVEKDIQKTKKVEKKPFVLKPHLTATPFKDDPHMRELKNSMNSINNETPKTQEKK